jgi:flagellar basal body-associated protein FliL
MLLSFPKTPHSKAKRKKLMSIIVMVMVMGTVFAVAALFTLNQGSMDKETGNDK